MVKYDYLIIGSGLFGATFAYKAKEAGKKCLVIEKRCHIGGNVFCETIEGINIHKYGAHIFHTPNKNIWDFVNKFVVFNNYRHTVLANNKGKLFNLPFNMNTFYQLWGTVTPKEAQDKIQEQRNLSKIITPNNLEEQAIFLVGEDLYKILIKEYTEKQWGRLAIDLPSFIIKRLPIRFVFNNNYFNDTYQGIPIGGYNILMKKLLENIEIRLNCNYFNDRNELDSLAKNIIFTGRIDEYFNYIYGKLDYRSLRFEIETINIENYQGCSVINYCDAETPYTRIIEHKHFEFGTQSKTVITREYPTEGKEGEEVYYPINNHQNSTTYSKYKEMTNMISNVYFGGRLAEYKYYDMHQVIASALKLAEKIII